MASVLNSKAKYFQYVPQPAEEAAKYSVESEGDLLIKELSRKQLDTNISLEKELNHQKEFHSDHVYQPITKSTAGTTSFKDFKKICSNESTPLSETNDNVDLLENKNIGRHLRELALAVKPNSLETKLLKFAITCNAVGQTKPDTRPPDHPLNQLLDIEHDRFAHLSDTSDPAQAAETILRKRKQLLEAFSEPVEIKRKPVVPRNNSLWDVTEAVTEASKSKTAKVYTCRKEKLFTIRDGKIVELSEDCGNSATLAKIVKNEDELKKRLAKDEVTSIPRFSNYGKGIPSKTLYLKNLAPAVEEENLSSLFSKYQLPDKPRITYKLMQKGKMRGQAFVNCHCLETAAKALEDVNGVILHGKPVIVQFSSKGNT